MGSCCIVKQNQMKALITLNNEFQTNKESSFEIPQRFNGKEKKAKAESTLGNLPRVKRKKKKGPILSKLVTLRKKYKSETVLAIITLNN